MRAIALVPLLLALTPRGPHGPIGDTRERTEDEVDRSAAATRDASGSLAASGGSSCI